VNSMPAGDIVDGRSLLRALQRHRIDDLDYLERLLATGGHANGGRVLLDLCAGIGRTVPSALRHGWDVICIDRDAVALAEANRIAPQRVVCHVTDLSCPRLPPLPPCHAVMCAHHAANEVGVLAPLFEVARRVLGPEGWFYLDVLTDRYPRPYELEYALPVESTDDGTWLLDTAMRPLTDDRHELLLVASHFDRIGIRRNQIHHLLTRTVFDHHDIVACARQHGLCLEEYEAHRYLFRRIETGARKEVQAHA
jgi:SAM-dependent methyltransferase